MNATRTVLMLLLLVCGAFARAADNKFHRSPMAVKDEYIVVLEDSVPTARIPDVAQRLGIAHSASIQKVWQSALHGFFARMPEGRAKALSHDPDVKYVEENAQMFLSARVPTNIDPACDVNCTVPDDRLWHLDVLDQNAAIASNDFADLNDGSGVYVYVMDTGVMRAHREFGNDANKVLNGFNASGDGLPAYDPCDGVPSPSDPFYVYEAHAHGTGVASVVAGSHLGVARGAKIVPVKVARCAEAAVDNLQRNTHYDAGDLVYANTTWYICRTAGTTGATAPTTWTWYPDTCCTADGSASFEYWGHVAGPNFYNPMTLQMLLDGLNWILSSNNPYPRSPAVVTLSTYRFPGEANASSIEDAIHNLLLNNITVVASANNQDANACDTTPGRLSRGNPSHPLNKVITAGGAMIRNNPDANSADGGLGLPEPSYDATKPTTLARWRCNAGDSDNCSGNIYGSPPAAAPNPVTNPNAYVSTTLGSNGGVCVSLFAPAKNIPVASFYNGGVNGYRDSRASAGWASGTSWSAPIVAGAVSRILQAHPTYTIDQVYTDLMNATTAMDTTELDPAGVTGTPNKFLRIHDMAVTTQPQSQSTPATLTVAASGTGPFTYQWYQVNATFDLTQYTRDAAASMAIAGATSSWLSVSPSQRTGYFARVRGSSGSVDSNIAVISLAPVAPAYITAMRNGSGVTVTWPSSANAQDYKLERKMTGLAWTEIATTTSTTYIDSPTPPADGVVVYRVRAGNGGAYSSPSTLDFAFARAFDDPVLYVNNTPVRASHLIEIRTAINAIAAAASIAPPFSAFELSPSSLTIIAAADFTTTMTRLNSVRTNAMYNQGNVGFATTPVTSGRVLMLQLENLRQGVQ